MEKIFARNLALDLEKKIIFPPTQVGFRAGKFRAVDSHAMSAKDTNERTNSDSIGRSGRCGQYGPVKIANGSSCTI